MSHIIGRPGDGLLDIMLGHGADPEQGLIRGSEQGRDEGDGVEDQVATRRRDASRPVDAHPRPKSVD